MIYWFDAFWCGSPRTTWVGGMLYYVKWSICLSIGSEQRWIRHGASILKKRCRLCLQPGGHIHGGIPTNASFFVIHLDVPTMCDLKKILRTQSYPCWSFSSTFRKIRHLFISKTTLIRVPFFWRWWEMIVMFIMWMSESEVDEFKGYDIWTCCHPIRRLSSITFKLRGIT